MKNKMQQAPIRNATTICASVYSHSGEFAPVYTDLQLTGRGLDFKFIRSYRSSLASHIGDLGRGWSSSMAKKIERKGDDIIYHNGAGEVYKFARKKNGKYTSPTGFYGILFQKKKHFFIHQRYGLVYRFEAPEKGGRILGREDRNHNSNQFSYSANAIVIIDSLKRKIDISINKGLLQELKDHAGRTWKYSYDKNDCLIEVTQPATADFPNGTSVKYAYDNNHRLISVTDAKGQQYLVNHYDKSGKVVAQEHGSGVFKIEYDAIGKSRNGLSIHRTTCIRKNGSRLVLKHSRVGNVISRTLYVRKESFAPQDSKVISENDVPLITNSVYNKNSELISRIFPAGNKTKWIYSEDAENPLNQGNLLQIIKIPQKGIESDQTKIVTKYGVEPKFQLITKLIDPRGNKTSHKYDEKGNLLVTTYPSVTIQPVNSGTSRPTQFDRVQRDEYQYNSVGQLLRRKHIDESITEYYYYPLDDPSGTRGPKTATNNPDKVCGYLARVVRDANGEKIKNEYAYDNFGNATTVWDGKSNPAHLRYNAIGKLESITSREPFKYRIDYKYDANYNEIESAQSFERLEYDEANQTTRVTSSTLRELTEYNSLDNVTLRKIVGDEKIITEYFIRDAAENIIRQLQPLGNATEYVYDERNLLIEKKFGVDTKETFSNQFTYTLNGAVRTYTDGNGKKTTNNYDGFHRYKGFTNPVGTYLFSWYDFMESDTQRRLKEIFAQRYGIDWVETTYVSIDGNIASLKTEKNTLLLELNNENVDAATEVSFKIDDGMIDKFNAKMENGKLNIYVGTNITQWFDEASNVVRVEIDDENPLATKKSRFHHNDSAPLLEAKYHFDQWNRIYRVDRAWHNQSNGDKLGESQWNGEKGIVSMILEYAENGLPGKVWTETDNVVDVEYDGVGRVVQMKDLTGEEFSFEYDENNNPTLMKCLGPEVEGKRFEWMLRRKHDEMDRLVWQQENDEAPERFAYNALGNVINYIGKSGIEIHHTDDSLGRRVGHAFTITGDSDNTMVQKIARRLEYDDNYRLSAYTDADGKRTMYSYDTLDRQTGVVYPDDNSANVEYDANGNIVRVVDQNNNEINNCYDASNRLVERQSHIKRADKTTVERYEYDGLSRMVAAIAPDGVIRRTYDSLSHLLTEQQGGNTLRFAHDSAGNLTSLAYPGGEEVHKMYDIRNRVTSVQNKLGETIASFKYRSNEQIAEMFLGNMIETSFSYNPQERLESIEYRRADDHKLVEGFRYQYDDTGKMTHEIQLGVGSTYGERYYYDDANRATRAQYGVQNVFDPNSLFDQETSCEYFPEGAWKRWVDVYWQGEMYLFSWDDIPGKDDGRLLEYLEKMYGFDWVRTEKIEKFDDCQTKKIGTIKISTVTKSLWLRLNDEKTKVYLKSYDGTTDEFIAKNENGKLNIYGEIIDEKIGTINQLNKYQNFGDISFTYDANGNCIHKSKPDLGDCKYTYDQDNKLIKSECYDAQGNKTQTIEYFYDSFGRQVRKVVTDKSDIKTETTFVWLGDILLEEWENGVLARTYFYGIGSMPVQLSVTNKDGRSDYHYTFNGRGSASGLVHSSNPTRFLERYGVELDRSLYVKEIDGELLDPHKTGWAKSSVGNSVSGKDLIDWANGTIFSSGGIQNIPGINMRLNGLNNFGKRVPGSISQIKDAVKIGGGNSITSTASNHRPGGKDPSWYGSMVMQNNPSKNYSSLPPDVVATAGTDQLYKESMGKNPEEEAGKAAADKAAADKAAADKAAADKAAADKAKAEKDRELIRQWEEHRHTREIDEYRNKQNKEAIENAKKDPDQNSPLVLTTEDAPTHSGYGPINLPSPRELEAKMGGAISKPVNPNSGEDFGSNGSSDQPSKSHVPGGIDPTIALVNGEGSHVILINTLKLFFGGGFTDPVRGGPGDSDLDEGRYGGKTPNNGRSLP